MRPVPTGCSTSAARPLVNRATTRPPGPGTTRRARVNRARPRPAAASPKAAKIGCRASTGDSVVGKAPLSAASMRRPESPTISPSVPASSVSLASSHRAPPLARVVVEDTARLARQAARAADDDHLAGPRRLRAERAAGVAAQHLDREAAARPARFDRRAQEEQIVARGLLAEQRHGGERRRVEHEVARVVGRDAVGVGDGDARHAARRQPGRQPHRRGPARLDRDRGVGHGSIVDREHDLRLARADAVVGHFGDEGVRLAPGRADGEVLDRPADVDDVQRQALGDGAGRMLDLEIAHQHEPALGRAGEARRGAPQRRERRAAAAGGRGSTRRPGPRRGRGSARRGRWRDRRRG